MKLFELMHQVDFDSMLPTLRKDLKVKSGIYSYREAFDELMLLIPSNEEGEITICRNKEQGWIEVNVNDYSWENDLNFEVNIEDGLSLNKDQLAAYILWELTYYGFSQKEIEQSFSSNFSRKRADNEYARKAHELLKRKDFKYARGKREKKEYLKSAINADVLFKIIERGQKRNRAKRMRDARIDRSIKRYKRWSNIEECIKKLTRLSDNISLSDLQYLFNTAIISENYFCQKKGNETYTTASLEELVDKYSDVLSSNYDSVILLLYSADKNDIPESQIKALYDLFASGHCLKRCIFRVESAPEITDGTIKLFAVTSIDDNIAKKRQTIKRLKFRKCETIIIKGACADSKSLS